MASSSYSNKLENNLSKSPPLLPQPTITTKSSSSSIAATTTPITFSTNSSTTIDTNTTTTTNTKPSITKSSNNTSINKLSSTALKSSIPVFDKNNNDKYSLIPSYSSNSITMTSNNNSMQNDNNNNNNIYNINDKESIDTNLNNIELRLKQQNIFKTPATVNLTDNENNNLFMNNHETPVATVINCAVGSTIKSCLQDYLNNSIDSNHSDIIMNIDNTNNNDKTASHQQHQAKSSSRNDLVLCTPPTSLSLSPSPSPQPINIDELSNFNETNNSIYNSKIIQSLSPNINYFNTQKNKQVPASNSFSSTTNNEDMNSLTNVKEKKPINSFKKPDIFINSIEIDDTSKHSPNNNDFDNDMKYDEDKTVDEVVISKDEKFEASIKKPKKSALAWVGRKVRKGVNKKSNNLFLHHSYHHPISSTRHQQQQQKSDHSDLATSINNSKTNSNNNNNTDPLLKYNMFKRINKIDWTENSRQGTHFWSEINNPQSSCWCYLNEPDALEFHKLDSSVRCLCSSKNETKRKCIICKIVAHDSCIDLLQQHVKCRITYRDANVKKKSFRDKEASSSSTSNSPINANHNPNLHHWICRKYDDSNFDNKCQKCLRSYTNRFGLQTGRTIISCSWCKASYHLKCFSSNLLKVDCNFGEFSQLVIPPSWIVKSVKSPLRSSYIMKSYYRSSKRYHQSEQSTTNTTSTANNSIAESAAANTIAESNSSNLLMPVNSSTQHSVRVSSRSFIVRPPSTPNITVVKPLIVLINPKSGGKLGPKLLKKFTWFLNARQVFDLTLPGGPRLPLHLFRNVPNLKLLVGGGDGTVGWVLSVIDQIKFLANPPSVAVLPLGTGNDLARALNWGGGYTDEPLGKILNKILESRSVKLDRWKISTQSNPDVDFDSLNSNDKDKSIDKLKNDVMNNYFSIGADAHVGLEFHERREANPHKFSSRWFNLFQYFETGSRDFIKKTWKDLKDYVQLECDGKNYTDLVRSRGYHCIICLNIPKMYSGTNPWGTSTDNNFQPQSINDGRLEVIGCFTSTLTKIQLGGTGERICQAKYVKITTSTYIPIQIDGEPAKLNPCIIEIRHKNQAIMLEHVKFNTDSPILGYHPNIIKNFEVKCVSLEDFQIYNYNKNIEMLEKKATYIGAICTSNLTDNLIKVKSTINLLIKNCANGFYTDKWSFLNGEEFYRISDDSDECLLDIVSTEEIIYILDENSTDKQTKNSSIDNDNDNDEEDASAIANNRIASGSSIAESFN